MDKNPKKERKADNGLREDQDFPGYPHYPSGEDIMNPQNGADKISGDEELANSGRISNRLVDKNPGRSTPPEAGEEEDDLGIVQGTEADITPEDLQMLGDKETDQDMGDDELVQGDPRVDDVEEEGDLDIPGAELDNDQEALGEEDEENNYYSLGGDRHESLEDDPSV